jgi:hypothetical protein
MIAYILSAFAAMDSSVAKWRLKLSDFGVWYALLERFT